MIRSHGAMRVTIGLFLTVVGLVAGCAPDGDRATGSNRAGATARANGGDLDMSRPSEFGFQTSVRTSLVEEGKSAYAIYCVGCHGASGDGNGKAARFLHPRPRNFQKANFKFSSTRAGRLPTDEDLRRTIVKGLKGSAMPGWDMIPTRTVTALIAYIKTFSPKWESRSAASVVPFVTDPYRSKSDKREAIARGEQLYHGYAICWSCHPSYVSTERINEHMVSMESMAREGFRPGLQHSEGKTNSEGEVIFPPDFTRDFVRSGARVEDIYRSIAAGITGTAMPTWIDSIELPSERNPGQPLVQRSDVWAIAYYVQSLILQRPAKLMPGAFEVRQRTQRILAEGEVPVWPPVMPAGEEMESDEDFVED